MAAKAAIGLKGLIKIWAVKISEYLEVGIGFTSGFQICFRKLEFCC